MKILKLYCFAAVFSSKGQQTKALIHALKYSSGGALEVIFMLKF